MVKIMNMRYTGVPAGAVYCGRGSPGPFGNPFYMRSESERDSVCDLYEDWIARPAQAALVARIKRELKGKDLVCWCAPARCHCETLARIANE